MIEIILELDLDEETRAAIEQATGGDPAMMAALARMAIIEYGDSEAGD